MSSLISTNLNGVICEKISVISVEKNLNTNVTNELTNIH
ncbi:hypothetical protein SAMN06265171_11371 [Chryseobacterium rhizoplanae]|uniref:Uncharacterized protein n=1 Tax=Chryseobacterium rhizoplanae TaxID=1609531 RepID=A0A521FBL4_9FLAO|nr:hypothetical protein SAMN06265171_11371 [Chryseobacterium rhizoplanae]